ncbi:MAG: hemoglobin [Phenylobacterium sp.]|jgi:hemoglobin
MLINKITFKTLLSTLVLLPMLLTTPTTLAHDDAHHKHDGPQLKQTLFNRLGGLAAISVVVDDFIDKVVSDAQLNKNPNINAARKRVATPYLKYQVTSMVCLATGGPCKYTGRSMKESHQKMRIKESEWARMIVLFKEVLAKHRVGKAETEMLLSVINSTKADIVMPSM